MSTSTPELYTREDKVKQLHQAEEHAREAVDIFTRQVKELPQLLQALIEWGCTYRNWARICEKDDVDRPALARKGEDALHRAIREAEGEPRLLHMAVDAQVNLAWLYHYTDRDGEAERELQTATGKVSPRYYITPDQGLPSRDLPQTFLWVQLGKAHLLHGEIAMARFLQSKDEGQLEGAAGHYALSLAYDELFSSDFRDMRRGTELIYDRLKVLNEKEFAAVYRGVNRTAAQYRLKEPVRIRDFLVQSFGPPPSSTEGR